MRFHRSRLQLFPYTAGVHRKDRPGVPLWYTLFLEGHLLPSQSVQTELEVQSLPLHPLGTDPARTARDRLDTRTRHIKAVWMNFPTAVRARVYQDRAEAYPEVCQSKHQTDSRGLFSKDHSFFYSYGFSLKYISLSPNQCLYSLQTVYPYIQTKNNIKHFYNRSFQHSKRHLSARNGLLQYRQTKCFVDRHTVPFGGDG